MGLSLWKQREQTPLTWRISAEELGEDYDESISGSKFHGTSVLGDGSGIEGVVGSGARAGDHTYTWEQKVSFVNYG